MIATMRRLMVSRRFITVAMVAAVFFLSATAALVINDRGNIGGQVAEAASRVNRQADETQDAFTDIRDLIPEKQRLEAAPQNAQVSEPTSGTIPVEQQPAEVVPSEPDDWPSPVSSDGYPAGHTCGINAASSDSESVADDDGERDSIGKKIVPPTLTFNEKAREAQGDKGPTQYQESMDRIIDNWTPQYKAAKAEHEELVERIDATGDLW